MPTTHEIHQCKSATAIRTKCSYNSGGDHRKTSKSLLSLMQTEDVIEVCAHRATVPGDEQHGGSRRDLQPVLWEYARRYQTSPLHPHLNLALFGHGSRRRGMHQHHSGFAHTALGMTMTTAKQCSCYNSSSCLV